MEHITNEAPILATGNRLEIARAPDGAAHGCIRPGERPADSPRRRIRADGWTAERIRIFLDTLAQRGVVAEAARAAGMSRQSAYVLRHSARGCSFDTGWRAALLCADGGIDGAFRSHVLHGRVDVIIRDGKVWGERHRDDNRLTMAVLKRLDQFAKFQGRYIQPAFG